MTITNLDMFMCPTRYPGWKKSHTTKDLDFLVPKLMNTKHIWIYSI